MSERTEFPIVTCLRLIRKEVTEFSFILVLMIKPFYSVVCPFAFLLLRTLLRLCELAKFGSIEIIVSSFIFYCVIVVATLVIMRFFRSRALDAFEIPQI